MLANWTYRFDYKPLFTAFAMEKMLAFKLINPLAYTYVI
jgi:hypothetical protein